jgi:hypothetical protein
MIQNKNESIFKLILNTLELYQKVQKLLNASTKLKVETNAPISKKEK